MLVNPSDLGQRYVGTVRTNSTNRTEDSVTNRLIWNYYNRVRRHLYKTQSTASWNYSTNAWRCSQNASGDSVAVVVGTTGIHAEFAVTTRGQNSSGAVYYVGIADVQGTPGCGGAVASTANVNGMGRSTTPILLESFLSGGLAVGYHVFQWVENGGGTTTTTFYGSSNAGIHGYFEG